MTPQQVRRIVEQVLISKRRPPTLSRIQSVGPDLRAVLQTLHEGERAPNVKAIHSPGIAGRLTEGAEVLALAVGGSSNNLVYIGVNDHRNRPDHEDGETVVYHLGGNGDYVKLRNGNIIEVKTAGTLEVICGAEAKVTAPSVSIVAASVNITGNLTVIGNVIGGKLTTAAGKDVDALC